MKNLLLLLFVLPVAAFAQINKTVPTKDVTPAVTNAPVDPDAPAFKFTEETWDFGEIPQGIPASHAFNFENAGKTPLVISQATASCGCTTPEWTKEPVLPSKTGTVKVTYNAAKEGAFTKTVTLLSNAGNAKYLTIKGNVIQKKMETPAAAPASDQK
jgi:hypothetical protein